MPNYVYSISIYIYWKKNETFSLSFTFLNGVNGDTVNVMNKPWSSLTPPLSLYLFTPPSQYLTSFPSYLIPHHCFVISPSKSLTLPPSSLTPSLSSLTPPTAPHLPHPSLLIPHPCILFHLTPLLPHPCSLTYSSYCTPVPLPPPPAHPIFTGSTTLHKSLPVSVPNSIIRENWVSELKNLMTLSL